MTNRRLAAWGGVVSFVIASVANTLIVPLWDGPGTQATAAEITSSITEDRSLLLFAMVLNTVTITLWLMFGAAVWLRLREATGGETFLSACFAFGLVAFVTLLFAGFTAFWVLAYRAPDVTEPKLLYDVTFGLLAMSGMPTAVALAAYAELVWRTRALPRWTALLAGVGAAAHVLLLASFIVEDGFFSLQGEVIVVIPGTLFVWILGTSIALLRESPSSRTQSSRF